MKKDKKLYIVYDKRTSIGSLDTIEQCRLLDYTHATSEKQAINFVKKKLGIKRKNRYVEDFNNGSNSIIYEICAKEKI